MDFTVRPINMEVNGNKYDFIICPGYPPHRWIPLTNDPIGMLRRLSNRLGVGSVLIESINSIVISTDKLTLPNKRDLFNVNNQVAMRLAWNDITRE